MYFIDIDLISIKLYLLCEKKKKDLISIPKFIDNNKNNNDLEEDVG
jgi:hypothetical protein